jgi:hypothetical protein
MFFLDLSSSLRANERLLLRRQVGDRQQQTTLAQGKWIAFIDSLFSSAGFRGLA